MAECLTSKEAPKLVTHDYTPKGEFKTLNGLKSYTVGPTTSKIAILDVYDVFGFASQTLQGADMLSHCANCLVVMPDFFDGGLTRDFEQYNQEQRAKAFGDFAGEGGAGSVPKCIAQINSAATAIKAQYPSVEKVASFGRCYGGKLVILASNHPETTLKASGQVHPSRLSADDAKALKIPHLILASKDEASADVEAFDKVPKPKGSETHTYPLCIHGWMGARADLNDPDNAEGFTRGYEQLASWILKVLT